MGQQFAKAKSLGQTYLSLLVLSRASHVESLARLALVQTKQARARGALGLFARVWMLLRLSRAPCAPSFGETKESACTSIRVKAFCSLVFSCIGCSAWEGETKSFIKRGTGRGKRK